jgi:hypothetical protein
MLTAIKRKTCWILRAQNHGRRPHRVRRFRLKCASAVGSRASLARGLGGKADLGQDQTIGEEVDRSRDAELVTEEDRP